MEPKSEEIKNQLRKFNLMGYADEKVKYEDNGKKGKILIRKDGKKHNIDWKTPIEMNPNTTFD